MTEIVTKINVKYRVKVWDPWWRNKSVHEKVFRNSWEYMFHDTQVQYNFISDYCMRLRMIWRIIQIEESVNMPRRITPSSICLILQIIQKPYTIIIIGFFFIQNNSYFKTFFIFFFLFYKLFFCFCHTSHTCKHRIFLVHGIPSPLT